MSSALDKLQERQAQKLLEKLQRDVYAHMRLNDEDEMVEMERRRETSRRERRVERFLQPAAREKTWHECPVPLHEERQIRGMPKSRDYWATIDISAWSKVQLDAACTLLDLPTIGKKEDLLSSIQAWINAPSTFAHQQERERVEQEEEKLKFLCNRVFACGRNDHGELGLGDRLDRSKPTEITDLRGKDVVCVQAGFDSDYAIAITRDGKTFAWGGDGRKLIEDDVNEFSTSNQRPSVVQSSSYLRPHEIAVNIDTIHVSCAKAGGHIAMVSRKGECYTWGVETYGELGTSQQPLSKAVKNKSTPSSVQRTSMRPACVSALRNVRLTQTSVGSCHTAAITRDGALYMWGACWSGQLGVGLSKRPGIAQSRLQRCFPSPTLVENLRGMQVTRVSCGALHTAAITSDGRLYTFGCGDGGRLGLGSNDDALLPELVTHLNDCFVEDVSCGNWHSLCIARPRSEITESSRSGHVYSFGTCSHGQLGLGKETKALLPTRLPSLDLRRIRCSYVSVSSFHSAAVTSNGHLLTWGQNASGCLGRLSSGDAFEPDFVPRSSYHSYGIRAVVSVSTGSQFTLFLTKSEASDQSKHQLDDQDAFNDIDTASKDMNWLQKRSI